jgi:hypothetical protein
MCAPFTRGAWVRAIISESLFPNISVSTSAISLVRKLLRNSSISSGVHGWHFAFGGFWSMVSSPERDAYGNTKVRDSTQSWRLYVRKP